MRSQSQYRWQKVFNKDRCMVNFTYMTGRKLTVDNKKDRDEQIYRQLHRRGMRGTQRDKS
jgi:hypothetical protein